MKDFHGGQLLRGEEGAGEAQIGEAGAAAPEAEDGKDAAKAVVYIISAIAAEIVMVLGYLVYEYFVMGYGAAAFPSVISNSVQAGTNIVLSLVLIAVLEKSHVWERAIQRR